MVTFLHHLIDDEGYYGRHGIGMFSIEPSCREHPGVASPRVLFVTECSGEVCPQARVRFWKTTTTQAYAAHLNIFLPPRSSCHTARSQCNLLVSDGVISPGNGAQATCRAAMFF